MSYASALTLFAAMVVLAILPGPGILAVVARTLTAGLRHGVATSCGIVAGDYIYIALALAGLAALAELMGGLFTLIQYVGALYLLGLGLSLFRPQAKAAAQSGKNHRALNPTSPWRYSFLAGLLTTLANPKAILFYVSFFPAFVDVQTVTVGDTLLILLIATFAVGGVMLGYALITDRASAQFRAGAAGKSAPVLRYGAGAMLVGSGLWLSFKV